MAPASPWPFALSLRWCVLLVLSLETTSLVFGPIKDLLVWQYPVTLFKPSISYSSQIIDDVFRGNTDNVSFLNPLGEEVVEVEFPNLNFAAGLASFLGYEYNAENLWSTSIHQANASPITMSALSQEVLDRLQTIVASPDISTRSQFYELCSQQLVSQRTGESQCWYSDHRETRDVKELLLYLVNQLNAQPAGIVFGTVRQNEVGAGSNISARIQRPAHANFDFSLFYGGQALGFGDAHVSEGISRFFTSELVPAVSNSVEAYLCLQDQNLDDVFFDHVAPNEALPLNNYLYRKHASDPAYLSTLLLPEYKAALQVCRAKETLSDKLKWLVDDGSLMDVWPRVTFDYVAETLIHTLEATNTLTKAEAGVMRATKFTYPGQPYVYADKRAKYNVFGDKSLQINSTKKIQFTTYKAAKTFPWRRHLLSEWYYHGLDRQVVASADEADYFVHTVADCVYTNSNKDEIQSHRVKQYSWAAAAAFTGCHPVKVLGDCASVPDLNNATRWHMTSYGAWDHVKLPMPSQPLHQLYTTVHSFEQFILAIRGVMSFPMVAIDVDNSRARPVAETTYWRNYVLADMGGLIDGALPFLTTLSLSMGQLEKTISIQQAKALYVQRFFNPQYNALSVGRPLYARSRMMVIPFLPYPLAMAANLQTPFLNVANDVLCAFDRLHTTAYMFVRGRDHNGMCSQVNGPLTGDRSKYDLMMAQFYNTNITSTLYEDQLASAIDAVITNFERITNTNVTRTAMQSAIASTYPALRLAPNFNHKVQAWRFYPLFFGRGETHHIPANFNQLYTNAGLKYTSQGFYMDYSMEGAYKMLTFVAIITSFATALFSIVTVVVPTLVAVARAPDVAISKDDLKALFSIDLACASYSSSILLPFNVLSGLIPVMEILVQLESSDTSMARQAKSLLAVFLCSWRFGVGVLSLATDMTLPGRISWSLAAFVTALFYATIHLGLAWQLEIYSRALVVVVVDCVLCAIAVYPILRWYKNKYASVIANSSINTLVNVDVIFIPHSGFVFTGELDGEAAVETEAYIASKHGRDVVVTRRAAAAGSAGAGGLHPEVKAYKLATPSLTHALEAAARYKTGLWVNFETRQVGQWKQDKHVEARDPKSTKGTKGGVVLPKATHDASAKTKHRAFSPLAIV